MKRSVRIQIALLLLPGAYLSLAGNVLRRELQNWLSSPDPSINHNIARMAHHKGTTSWFLQGSVFEQWESSPLLWIHGKRTFRFLHYSPPY